MAQTAQTPEQTAQAITQSQTNLLKLTPAQQEQVYTIHLGITQKNQGILASNYAEDQKNAILKSNEEARMNMLKSVLTVEQFAKLELSLKEEKQH